MDKEGRGLLGEKVLTREEMVRVEALAIKEQGEKRAREYMEKAGSGIATSLIRDLKRSYKKHFPKREVLLLCGPGNNGGDAFVVGALLLKKGFSVEALEPEEFKKRSSLCEEKRHEFLKKGGKIHGNWEVLDQKSSLFILDGLFGTGFLGTLEGSFKELAACVNKSFHKVYSIDIPSGLSDEALSQKQKERVILKASKTFYLGFTKEIFFFEDALDYCGELEKIDFGLEEKYKNLAQSNYSYVSACQLSSRDFPSLERTSHKHESGKCFLWAGSHEMPGAGILATRAAYRSGGRLVHLSNTSKDYSFLAASPEVMPLFLDLKSAATSPSKLLEKMNSHHAALIGPGIGLGDLEASLLQKLSMNLEIPLVLDADALTLFAKKSFSLPENTVMTPHLGELARLLGLKKTPFVTKSLLENCREFAKKNKVTLVVKGAPTFIVDPVSDTIRIFASGDPGMATAGSGDVLAGMICSFLAQGLEPLQASTLGVICHGEAGRLAARKKTSYSLVASDLIRKIPKVFKRAFRQL